MEAPKCKLCGERHTLNEPHVFKLEPKREPVKVQIEKVEKAQFSMPTSEQVNREWLNRKHCPTCTCKRVYKTAAERQKAYRERHKAK